MSDPEPRSGGDGEPSPLREVLAAYDRKVDQLLDEAARAPTGTGRVQTMFLVRRAVAIHDSVVESALCPVLEDLPGGADVATTLREGCRRRAALLSRFQRVTQGVAAHNVYASASAEIEDVLARLTTSFHEHESAETTEVAELLDRSADLVDPDVVSARMAIEVGRAPTRAHAVGARRLRRANRLVDTFRDWSDSRHRWPAAERTAPTRWPTPSSSVPSIRSLLASYDTTVEGVIVDLRRATSPEDRLVAAHRLVAAITVHDAVVAGSLCTLLDSVDDGHDVADRLRQGCQQRAELLRGWHLLIRGLSPEDLVRLHLEEADEIVEGLIVSFGAHAHDESSEVAAFVERLRERAWPTRGSAAGGLIAAGPNPEPGVLAASMALSAATAPSRTHPLLARHPSNRLIRAAYRGLDRAASASDSWRGWSTRGPTGPGARPAGPSRGAPGDGEGPDHSQ